MVVGCFVSPSFSAHESPVYHPRYDRAIVNHKAATLVALVASPPLAITAFPPFAMAALVAAQYAVSLAPSVGRYWAMLGVVVAHRSPDPGLATLQLQQHCFVKATRLGEKVSCPFSFALLLLIHIGNWSLFR